MRAANTGTGFSVMPLNDVVGPFVLFVDRLLGYMSEIWLPELSVCFGEVDLRPEALRPLCHVFWLRMVCLILPFFLRFHCFILCNLLEKPYW